MASDDYKRFIGKDTATPGLWKTLRGTGTPEIDSVYLEVLGHLPSDASRGHVLWKLGWSEMFGEKRTWTDLSDLRKRLQERATDDTDDSAEPLEGVVRLNNRCFSDARGSFLGLGCSLFPAIWASEFAQDRLAKNLRWWKAQGGNYVRILGMVGAQPYWKDRVVDPSASWYRDARARLFNSLERAGLRAEVTLFADAQVMMSEGRRREMYIDNWVDFSRGREHLFQHWELWNEYWQNGATLDELRERTAYLRRRTSIPVAASAPSSFEPSDFKAMYSNDMADLATVHPDRTEWENGWRWTRQAWEYADIAPFTNNEPNGPRASVGDPNSSHKHDPNKIISDMINTHIAGGAGYVYHTHAGVRFDQDLWTERNSEQIGRAFRVSRQYLPRDLPNWQRQNHHWAGHPFKADFAVSGNTSKQIWPDGHSTGVVRAFAATQGEKYLMLLTGIKHNVTLGAGTYKVFDPLLGSVLFETVLSGGGYSVRGNDVSRLVIGGR